ncbi:MAG: efflux RND transporter periplasmic adaptor subunit [Alphaproteobacteria bacterium]
MISGRILILVVATGILVAVAAGLATARLALQLEASESHPNNEGTNDDHGDDDTHKTEPVDDHDSDKIELTEAQVALAEIKTVAASPATVENRLNLVGEVTANRDRLVEVVPAVAGIAREVHALLGAELQQGDLLATLDSRELADAKADWIAARERKELAKANFERSERLWKKKIAPEEEYLDARSKLAEASITERTAEHKLRALGLSRAELRSLTNGEHKPYTRHTVRAPIGGTVIEKHITKGQVVDGERPIYQIADLSVIWVIVNIYEGDFRSVEVGQRASIVTKAYPDRKFEGKVTWLSAVVEEASRTLRARIEVPNEDRALRPGMFITAEVVVDQRTASTAVPTSAIRRADGRSIVFVQETPGIFEKREVQLGLLSGSNVEILKGVKSGEIVVTDGSFILKSEAEKSGFEAGHGH